jgi:hypothetical protein
MRVLMKHISFIIIIHFTYKTIHKVCSFDDFSKGLSCNVKPKSVTQVWVQPWCHACKMSSPTPVKLTPQKKHIGIITRYSSQI